MADPPPDSLPNSPPPELRVFVYGTLKPGECNHLAYCGGRVAWSQGAKIRGALYGLPLGYPGLAPGEGWVEGVLLGLQPRGLGDSLGAILADLDSLEDFDPHRDPQENLYDRQQHPIYTLGGEPLGLAWVYTLGHDRIEGLGGWFLPQGVWRGDAITPYPPTPSP